MAWQWLLPSLVEVPVKVRAVIDETYTAEFTIPLTHKEIARRPIDLGACIEHLRNEAGKRTYYRWRATDTSPAHMYMVRRFSCKDWEIVVRRTDEL